MQEETETDILANRFEAMPSESFENFSTKNSQIASVNRNRSVSIEKTSKGRIFVIETDTNKSFMKLEYSVIQNFSMMHPYKWAGVLFKEKKYLVQWTLVITNFEWTTRCCLI